MIACFGGDSDNPDWGVAVFTVPAVPSKSVARETVAHGLIATSGCRSGKVVFEGFGVRVRWLRHGGE